MRLKLTAAPMKNIPACWPAISEPQNLRTSESQISILAALFLPEVGPNQERRTKNKEPF